MPDAKISRACFSIDKYLFKDKDAPDFYNSTKAKPRPEVEVTGGDFLWLSAPKPIGSDGTPFPAGVTDLQAWIRNANLKPDWLRIGTDIVDGPTAWVSNGGQM